MGIALEHRVPRNRRRAGVAQARILVDHKPARRARCRAGLAAFDVDAVVETGPAIRRVVVNQQHIGRRCRRIGPRSTAGAAFDEQALFAFVRICAEIEAADRIAVPFGMTEEFSEMLRQAKVHVAHREHIRRGVFETVMRVVGGEPDRAVCIDDVQTDARRGTRAQREAAKIDRARARLQQQPARMAQRAAADSGNHAADVVDFESAGVECGKRIHLVAQAGLAFDARRSALGPGDGHADPIELIRIEMETRLAAPGKPCSGCGRSVGGSRLVDDTGVRERTRRERKRRETGDENHTPNPCAHDAPATNASTRQRRIGQLPRARRKASTGRIVFRERRVVKNAFSCSASAEQAPADGSVQPRQPLKLIQRNRTRRSCGCSR